jgi:hypothetical protein
MPIEIVKISPETFKTLFLRAENNVILLTQDGRRIIVKQFIPEEWKPVRIYDLERQLNENKREIVLIDKLYRNQIVKEFRETLKV